MSIRKNSVINFFGTSVPLLLTLITLPWYIKEIGEDRFAVVSIAWIILGYFGFFDLGLGQATASEVAKSGGKDSSKTREIYWTALIINGCFGLIGGGVAWVFGYVFFSGHFATSYEIKTEILGVLPWLAVAVPIATLSGVQIGCLQGKERFWEISKISILGSFLSQVVPLIAAVCFSPTLSVVMPATVLCRVVIIVLLANAVRKDFPILNRPVFNRVLAQQLLGFGGWVTISGIISPILTTFDRFLIGAIIGAKAVTHYTVSYNLASRVSIFPSSLSVALFPKLSGASMSDRKLYARNSISALIALMFPLLAFGIFNFQTFLRLWMGPDFAAKSGGVGELVLLGMLFNSLARIPYVSLQASGRPDVVAKCHLLEVIPYCVILYFATKQFGIVGAAAAWTLRSGIDALLLFRLHGIERDTFIAIFSAFAVLLGVMLYAVIGPEISGIGRILLNAIFLPPMVFWGFKVIKKIKNP